MKYQDQNEQLFVVGHPVAHSKSPEMHNAVYAALGFPWKYGRKDCETEEEARTFFHDPRWLALNITMPYKPLAYSVAERPTDYARAIQGANVLIHTDEGLYADNTDGRGCIAYLKRCGCDIEGARIVVCGTGPTSLSIMFAAAHAGARTVYLLSRDSQKAASVLEAFQQRIDDEALASILFSNSYNGAVDEITVADIIIDATPLGMQSGDPAPFDAALLHEGQVVLDVVYGHGQTAIIRAARNAGCQAYDGSGMLVEQAVETVYDIQEVLDIPITLDASALFTIMAEAAGFTECL